MYWKDAGGIELRNSYRDDNIGDINNFVSISLTNLKGCEGYDSDHYEFHVCLYLDNDEISDLYENIEDVINDYNQCCKILNS